jgi:hypothetical protein
MLCSSAAERFEPTALCAEGPDGVFARPYSLGTPRLDCNSFEAELPFGFL